MVKDVTMGPSRRPEERDRDTEPKRTRGRLLPWRLPRLEVLILLLALVCTVAAKGAVLARHKPSNAWVELLNIVWPDLVFFFVLLIVIRCLYMVKSSAGMARVSLLIAMATLGWSLLNGAWLVATSVQIQPGVVRVLAQNPFQFWPIVRAHVAQRLAEAIPVCSLVAVVGLYVLWRLIKPPAVSGGRVHHARRAAAAAVVLVCLLLAKVVWPQSQLGFGKEVLGFSSHVYALTSWMDSHHQRYGAGSPLRRVPRDGQRRIGLPDRQKDDLPNVVVILLESISHASTSLGDPKQGATPFLAKLAAEGVEFRETRVPVSSTTKAFWAVLTSVSPVIEADYAEAIPVDEPYESLASILRRVGYRSAFFEMSKGTFECAPGLFSNLGFDWAWFRENLQDPSAHIGYLGGDDCRMIEPAFQWVDEKPQPFLLVMITSVSHDPYEVPRWFDKPAETDRLRYVQTVRYTDLFIEKVCGELQRRNLTDRTLVCVIGDHGTSFRVKAGRGRWVPYEEVIRVPWVMRWPGHIPPGTRIDWPCSQLDVTPTILKLLGFDISQAGFEGKDVLSPCEPDRRLYFACWYANSPLGFIEGDVKWIYWPYIDKLYRYDLAVDPLEEDPVLVSAQQAEPVVRDVLLWRNQSEIAIDARRFRQALVFDHWRIFSVGRSAWAYYVR